MDYIDKLIKITLDDSRIIIGNLKSLDYNGNFYLSNSVEVFSKEEGFISQFELFDNSKEHTFSFDSEKNQYQIMGDVCLNKKLIKKISSLKQ